MDNTATNSIDQRTISNHRFLKYMLLGPLLVFKLAICALTLVHLSSLDKNEIITVMRQYNQVSRINFEFKVQVQEWKNFLLRGKNGADLGQQWKHFELQERRVQEISQSAIASMSNPILVNDVKRFVKSHAELGKKYRQARDDFIAHRNLKSADFFVRGVDRQPAAMLNNAMEHARIHVYQERRKLEKYSNLILISAIVLLLVLAIWLIAITYVGTLRTLQDAKTIRMRMERIANTDSLTGIYNRRYFEEHLNRLLIRRAETSQPFDIFYFDLNGFKQINDSYGHDVGDELLQLVAERLKSFFGQNGIVARHGGDEFLALFEEASDVSPKSLIQQMQEVLTQPIVLAGHVHQVCCSIGHSRFPDDGSSSHALVRKADHTMYGAKQREKIIPLLGDCGTLANPVATT